MAKRKKNFTIPVKFEEKPESKIELTAFLFNARNELIQTSDVADEQASFSAKVKSIREVRVLIAPKNEKTLKSTSLKELLYKHKAHEILPDLRDGRITALPIPSKFIPIWSFRKCRVRGNVSKYFDISGFSDKKGLCDLRVHICEVDRIRFILPEIPDYIIDLIPDLVLHPDLPVPIPVDPPIPIDPPDPIGPFPRPEPPRLRNFKDIFSPKNSPGSFKSIPRALKPTALSESQSRNLLLEDSKIKNALNTRNTGIIRNSILENFKHYHHFFCWHKWLWPYFYRCDELKVVYTDTNGNFDTEIWYNISGDHPDIYIWLEAQINGEWQTVYRPSIPCTTHWDYVCSTPINIIVTHPELRWECSNAIDGNIIWVKTIGYGTSVHHIEQHNTTGSPIQGVALNRQGLTDKFESAGNYRRPFAASLRFVLQFSSDLPSSGLTYYRWSYQKVKHADLSNASGSAVKRLDNTVNKGYSFENIDSDGNKHFHFNSVRLGPFDVGTEQDLYLIPPPIPSDAPFNVTESNPHWNQNTNSIGFDSNSLEGDGLYEFTLELFDSNGHKITNIPNELFQIPHYNTFYPSVNAPAEYLRSSGSGTCNAFKMLMRIDNSKCECEIYKIEVDSTPADVSCCGFVEYKPNSNIEVKYKAFHPQNFADFNFRIRKGTCSDSTQEGLTNASGMVISNANGYTRNPSSIYEKSFTPSQLLGICSSEGRAAFAQRLNLYALATNGNQRISSLDASDLAAFALEPE